MSYALYSNGKYLGPLAPIGLMHESTQIVERHARLPGQRPYRKPAKPQPTRSNEWSVGGDRASG
jgi:hypothetical protein